MKISKKSWHYEIISRWGEISNVYTQNGKSNICLYLKGLLAGLFNLVLIAIMSTIGLLSVIIPIEYLIASLTTGYFGSTIGYKGIILADVFLIVGIAMYTFSLIGLILFLVHTSYKKLTNKVRINKNSLIVNAYKSFKDKVCIIIDFE